MSSLIITLRFDVADDDDMTHVILCFEVNCQPRVNVIHSAWRFTGDSIHSQTCHTRAVRTRTTTLTSKLVQCQVDDYKNARQKQFWTRLSLHTLRQNVYTLFQSTVFTELPSSKFGIGYRTAYRPRVFSPWRNYLRRKRSPPYSITSNPCAYISVMPGARFYVAWLNN